MLRRWGMPDATARDLAHYSHHKQTGEWRFGDPPAGQEDEWAVYAIVVDEAVWPPRPWVVPEARLT